MPILISYFIDLLHLKGNIYLTDVLDILIIALLIYSLFIFFTRSKTYLVFLGLAIAVGLYILAKFFNLYLTLMTLKYFAGISAIIVVIIFQTEIRKYFEFLGLVGTRQVKVGSLAPHSPITSEIVQACVQMAQNKIGALIVIQGNDVLDSFIDGGIDLDGVISEEVLLSIFDPHSEGHDGALIISNNRISKFGTHLPLSNNFKEIGKHGTRHSAALGLSENTDALCIISSEEKGKISICKEGKLKTLSEFTDLEKELGKYIKAKFTSHAEGFLGHFIGHNLAIKAGALVFASIIWFFTAYQTEIVQKSFTVPVKLENLPKDTLVADYSPKEINITTSARGNNAFSGISPDDFKINLDISNLQGGLNKESLSRKNITIPANLSLVYFEPDAFLLTADKYFTAKVNVTVKIKGDLPKDFILKSTIVTPDHVDVLVPQGTTAPIELNTETIDISNQTESVIIPIKLIVPEGIKLANGDSTVNVALTIER